MKKTAIFAFTALAAIALMVYPNVATACGGSSSGAKMSDAGAAKATVASSTNTDKVEGADSYTTSKSRPVTKMAEEASESDEPVLVTFAVKGMSGSGCEGRVRQALSTQKGVAEVVQVCHKSDVAVVKYDPKAVEPAQLVSVVNKLGYEIDVEQAVMNVSGEELKDVSKEKSIDM
jgi:copper chaperone CopZ